MKLNKFIILVTSLTVILLSSCIGGIETETPSDGDPQPRILNVMTHDLFAVSENLIANFEDRK